MAQSSNRKTALILAVVAVLAAVVRFFMKGWVEPLGVPTIVGSLLASVTVVVLIGLVLLFRREGRNAEGSYIRAALWFAGFAGWCEVLVIAGILVTERTGADTYFSGPWEVVYRAFPTPSAHVIGHTQGFFIRLVIGFILGAIVYGVAKRSRDRASGPASA